MNRYALILAAAYWFMSGQGWAQSSLAIQPTVLIEAKKGTGLGAYEIGYKFDQPHSFVVNEKGEIYVLDAYNNRVQHYDAKGTLIDIASIPSTSSPTKEERKRFPLLSSIVVNVDHLDLVDGKVYALYSRGEQARHLYVLRGNAFVNVDAEPGSDAIKRKLSPRYSLQQEKKRSEASATKFGLPPQIIAKISFLENIATDTFHNVWVVDADYMRVFSPSGQLLSEINGTRQGRTVLSNGNLYVMNLFSSKLGLITNFDTVTASDIDGIRILKYSLQGK